ncbi:hypothetical protein [Devosia aquimaris]|uniref:hypothetical protein n=1 Tax=Devosia aquimaris TaxID=2866214 RepID=UPI001CD16EB0|nr:hypothetical protein [Devosia sp. CJK-A8-3]
MRRLMCLIAALFAFAAVGGVATTNAMAFSSVPVVQRSTDSCAEASTVPSAVLFKSCGHKSSGLVMPCPPQVGVLSETSLRLPMLPRASHTGIVAPIEGPWVQPVSLRPPIAA